MNEPALPDAGDAGTFSSPFDAGSWAPDADLEAASPSSDAATEEPPVMMTACGSTPIVLANNLSLGRWIAAGPSDLYFSEISETTEGDAIYRIPKRVPGATPDPLTSDDPQPLSLATDGTYVYWNDTLSPGAILRIRPGDTAATTLLPIDVWGVALGSSSLFWVTMDGVVQSMPKSGGTVVTLGTPSPAAQGGAVGVAVDANNFYFAYADSSLPSQTHVDSIPVAGGPITTLATTSTGIDTLAVDDAYVYYVDGGTLKRVPIGGGSPLAVASGFSNTVTLKVDSGNVYATVSPANGPIGSVIRAPAGGGAAVTLATSQNDPWGMAIDDACVYWANYDSVMMVAK